MGNVGDMLFKGLLVFLLAFSITSNVLQYKYYKERVGLYERDMRILKNRLGRYDEMGKWVGYSDIRGNKYGR